MVQVGQLLLLLDRDLQVFIRNGVIDIDGHLTYLNQLLVISNQLVVAQLILISVHRAFEVDFQRRMKSLWIKDRAP